MLHDIQTYMAQHGTVSVADLALHFRTQPTTLQPMLDKLCRKGRIRQLLQSAKCTGCTACDQGTLEFYEWLGKSPPGLQSRLDALQRSPSGWSRVVTTERSLIRGNVASNTSMRGVIVP